VQPAQRPYRSPTGAASQISRRTRVLVVDDEPPVRTLLRRILALEGYEVTEASDGRSALDALRRDDPQLILLDLALGAESGLDVLAALRRRTDVPVILVSGSAEDGDQAAGLRLGADDYLVKPFCPNELSSRVMLLLGGPGRIAVRPLAG
jgi:DNA-binding response OmpR family regulator